MFLLLSFAEIYCVLEDKVLKLYLWVQNTLLALKKKSDPYTGPNGI